VRHAACQRADRGNALAVLQAPLEVEPFLLRDLALADLAAETLGGTDQLAPHVFEVEVELLDLADRALDVQLGLRVAARHSLGSFLQAHHGTRDHPGEPDRDRHRGQDEYADRQQHMALRRGDPLDGRKLIEPQAQHERMIAALHGVRDEIHLIALVAEMKVIARRRLDGRRRNRAVELARVVADLREHDLAAEHDAVEQGDRAAVEAGLIERLELVRDQTAVDTQRIHEALGIALAHDGRNAEIQRRHECGDDHQHHAGQSHPQAVD